MQHQWRSWTFILFVISSCASGDVLLKGRIHHGSPATIEKYPYIVFVRTLHRMQSSGTPVIVTGTGVILSDRWVATAGHILESDRYTDEIRQLISAVFVAGITDLKDYTGIYRCAEVFVHPLFNSAMYYQYDIGLMKPTQPIIFSAKTMPIPMGFASDVVPNTIVDVCGWGNSDEDGIRFNNTGGAILLEARMLLLSLAVCRDINERDGYQAPGDLNICVVSVGPYAHRGDSGGPVVINNKLIGLVASGQSGYPTFATSIPHMRTYITMVTGLL